MMYPFLTLDDGTEIVHSEMWQDGSVMVCLERHGSCHAACYLPAYWWADIDGFSEAEVYRYEEVIRSTAHLILQFAQEGGFDGAASF